MMGSVFTITLLSRHLVKRLAHTKLDQLLTPVFKQVADWLGPSVGLIAKSFGKDAATATTFCSNLLRSNAILVLVTTFLTSIFDVYRWTTGRISTRQLLLSLLRSFAASLGGCYGFIAGAALGTAISPGVGTFLAGLLGGWVGSAALVWIVDFVFNREKPGTGSGEQLLIPAL